MLATYYNEIGLLYSKTTTARQIGLSGFVPPLSTKESFSPHLQQNPRFLKFGRFSYKRIPDFSNLVDFLTKEAFF